VTHEERAKRIKWIFFILLAAGVAAGVWFYPKPAAPVANTAAAIAEHDLEIILYHLPKSPECEQMGAILDKVAKKYGKQILVSRIDITANPKSVAAAAAEKVTKPPKVVMMAGEVRACKFQGLWTQSQVERKVEEILRGLKRVDKDWRPDVKGMQPGDDSAPAPPVKPAQR
jgi:thioredoxin-like negative regulator of GroEL